MLADFNSPVAFKNVSDNVTLFKGYPWMDFVALSVYIVKPSTNAYLTASSPNIAPSSKESTISALTTQSEFRTTASTHITENQHNENTQTSAIDDYVAGISHETFYQSLIIP